ncbi:MAG: DUF4124 domain-containing protein [Pseudomonadota bacterium]
MMPSLRILFLASLLAPSIVQAQIYICKDAAGRTLTSDRPMPECANRSIRELDGTGITRREIAPPLSAEQKRERQLQEEKQRAIAAEIEERRLYDRALMTRYRNNSDIAIARQRAISLLEDQMRIDTSALEREMKVMKTAEAAVAATADRKGGVSPVDQKRLEEAARVVELRLSSIESRTAEIERTNQRFDHAVKRFNEIKSALETGRSADLPR